MNWGFDRLGWLKSLEIPAIAALAVAIVAVLIGQAARSGSLLWVKPSIRRLATSLRLASAATISGVEPATLARSS